MNNFVLPAARSPGRNALNLLVRIVVIATAYFVLPFEGNWFIFVLLGLILLGLLPFAVRRFAAVLSSANPLADAVTALATTLLTLIFTFSAIYFVMSVHAPASMSGISTKVDSLYFETTMFSTVGFGDIVAVSQTARVVATVNMLMNMVFLGTTLRMLTWVVNRRSAENRGVPPEPLTPNG